MLLNYIVFDDPHNYFLYLLLLIHINSLSKIVVML